MSFHALRAILAGVSASALLITAPLVAPSIVPAAAQLNNSIVEFRTGHTLRVARCRWGSGLRRVSRAIGTVYRWKLGYSEDYGWY